MGFHVCEYCGSDTSSGDITLRFDNGRIWTMPDMILHYIAEHDYKPEALFIEDVGQRELVGGDRAQTKGVGINMVCKVGYLTGPFETWGAKDIALKGLFFMRLWELMREAEKAGSRRQTRGFSFNHPRLEQNIKAAVRNVTRGGDMGGDGDPVPV